MVNKSRHIYSKKRFWAGILFAQIVLFYLLSKVPFYISLNESFFDIQKHFHQKIFSYTRFSIGDYLYILLFIFLLLILIKILNKEKRSFWFKQLLIGFNIIYFLYQILWGMLYFQKPISENLPQNEITDKKLKILAEKYLLLCVESRKEVEEDSKGIFSIINQDSIEDAILQGQNKIPEYILQKETTNIKSFKPSVFSNIMSYTGILGYYNPFTSEAQYNKNLPHTSLAFTLMHESAHQIGIARESEANFIGFLIGKESNNKALKHCSNWFALKSILRSLIKNDPKFVDDIMKRFSDGMKRDHQHEKQFVKDHQSSLSTVFFYTNDWFLKLNQQDGVVSYSYFTQLLVQYENVD